VGKSSPVRVAKHTTKPFAVQLTEMTAAAMKERSAAWATDESSVQYATSSTAGDDGSDVASVAESDFSLMSGASRASGKRGRRLTISDRSDEKLTPQQPPGRLADLNGANLTSGRSDLERFMKSKATSSDASSNEAQAPRPFMTLSDLGIVEDIVDYQAPSSHTKAPVRLNVDYDPYAEIDWRSDSCLGDGAIFRSAIQTPRSISALSDSSQTPGQTPRPFGAPNGVAAVLAAAAAEAEAVEAAVVAAAAEAAKKAVSARVTPQFQAEILRREQAARDAVGREDQEHRAAVTIQTRARGLQPVSRAPEPTVTKTPLEELVDGAKVEGKITSVMSYGAFVDIGAAVEGLLHVSEISNVDATLEGRDRPIRDATEKFTVGESITCMVKGVHLKNQQLYLTCKEPQVPAPRDDAALATFVALGGEQQLAMAAAAAEAERLAAEEAKAERLAAEAEAEAEAERLAAEEAEAERLQAEAAVQAAREATEAEAEAVALLAEAEAAKVAAKKAVLEVEAAKERVAKLQEAEKMKDLDLDALQALQEYSLEDQSLDALQAEVEVAKERMAFKAAAAAIKVQALLRGTMARHSPKKASVPTTAPDASADAPTAAPVAASATEAEAANVAAAHFGLDSKTQQMLDRLSNPKAPGARLKASLRKAALGEATAAKFRTSSSEMPESASPRLGPSMSLDADAEAVEAASQVALLKDELNAEASAEAEAPAAAPAASPAPAGAQTPDKSVFDRLTTRGSKGKLKWRKAALAEATAVKFRTNSSNPEPSSPSMPESASPRQGLSMSLNTNAEAAEVASQVALLKDELSAEASAEAAAAMAAAEAAKAEVAAAEVAKAEAAAAEAANVAAAHFGLDSKTQQMLDRLSNPKAPGARLNARLRKAALAEATAAKFRTSSSMPEPASPRLGPSMSLDADAEAVEAASQVALLKDELNAEASAEAPAAKAAASLAVVPALASAPAQKTVGLAPTAQQTIDRLANPRAPRARLQDNLRKAARTETVATALLQGRAGGPAFRAPPPAGPVPRAPSPG